jgi:hypothetical protein
LPANTLGPTTVAVLPLVEVKVAVPMVRFTPAAPEDTWRLQGRTHTIHKAAERKRQK